jgi:hypothetical protein
MWNLKHETISTNLGTLGVVRTDRPYLENAAGDSLRRIGRLLRDGDNYDNFEYTGTWNEKKLLIRFESIHYRPQETGPNNVQEVFLAAGLDKAGILDEYGQAEAAELLKKIMRDICETLMTWPNPVVDDREGIVPAKKVLFAMNSWNRMGQFKSVNFEENLI